MKVITSFQTLMRYATALGDAKKSGDPVRIAEAQKQHDDYHAMCLQADEMLLGCTYADLA